MNNKPHKSSKEVIRYDYKFIQQWPKDGAYPTKCYLPYITNPTKPVLFMGTHIAERKRSRSVSDIEDRKPCIYGDEPDGRRKVITKTNSATEHHFERVLSFTKSNDKKRSRHFSDNSQIRYYCLPPMLLPAMRKSKVFDFKAMNANKPPIPPIDPFYYSSSSRRRRAAKEVEEARKNGWSLSKDVTVRSNIGC